MIREWKETHSFRSVLWFFIDILTSYVCVGFTGNSSHFYVNVGQFVGA